MWQPKTKTFGVWFEQENQVAYAVKARTREGAIRKAVAIWKREHREPELSAVEELPSGQS